MRVRIKAGGELVFDVRFRDKGKSKSLSFEREQAAQSFRKTLAGYGLDTALATLQVGSSEQVPTVDEYAEIYMRSKSGLEGRTLDHYRSYMRDWISPVMGPLPLDAVRPATIAGWVNDQAEQGAASKSIKNRHGFLSAMFQHAVDADPPILNRNPCKGTRIAETEHKEMVVLSRDEFDELYRFIPERWQPVVLMMLLTGIRWGEVTALRPGDFDLEREVVHISRAWKWSKAKKYYIGPPKTKMSRRTISLPRRWRDTILPLVEAAEHEYVFTNARGGPIRDQSFYEVAWNPARRLANGLPALDPEKNSPDKKYRPGTKWNAAPSTRPIRKTPRIHDLRHTHASWLIAGGTPLNVVQRRMGHESIKTTVDTYGHLAPDYLAVSRNAMDRAMGDDIIIGELST